MIWYDMIWYDMQFDEQRLNITNYPESRKKMAKKLYEEELKGLQTIKQTNKQTNKWINNCVNK